MCNSLVIVIVIVLNFNSPSTAVKSDNEENIDKKLLKQSFDKLLYQVVDLNQQRLDAINRVLQLEDYFPSLRSSRAHKKDYLAMLVRDLDSNYEYDSAETDIQNSLIDYLRERDEGALSDEAEGLSIDVPKDDLIYDDETVDRKAALRGWHSCRKAASKTCRKACIAASKNVCSDYKCNKRMKKAFKKECKKTCEDKFND